MKMPSSRKIHLWVGVIFAIPALLIFSTGILLQIKNQARWIQPEVMKASGQDMTLTMAEIYEMSKSVTQAEIKSWSDIAQVDWRPDKGLIRVRTKNWTEIQIDASQKTILNSGTRWTALIIALHEGTWFSPAVKYGIFLPTAFALWALWLTGIIMGMKTVFAKFKKRKVRT